MFCLLQCLNVYFLFQQIVGKKSDSQVINELQQTTMTKSKSMAKSLEKILYNQTYVYDSLLLELNSYQDICAMVSVKVCPFSFQIIL